jgi:type IV pilus assembly protein PilB
MAVKIGQLLVGDGLITETQLEEALRLQKREGGRIGSILIKLGYLTEEKLVGFLSWKFGIPSIDLSKQPPDPSLKDVVPAGLAKRHCLIPVERSGTKLKVAMADPLNLYAVDDIKYLTGYDVDVVVASESSIKKAIKEYYGYLKGTKGETESLTYISPERTTEREKEKKLVTKPPKPVHRPPILTDSEINKVIDNILKEVRDVEKRKVIAELEYSDSPVIKLVNNILITAIYKNASDIHIEPYENILRIRYRIDGILYDVINLPLKIKNALTSRIKIMANLDIAERRLPQDGRIKIKIGKKREIDFRVSTLPCLFGEKTVLRILDKSSLQVDMTKLGFEKSQLETFKSAIETPYGMILVTGPTGSGKTTTLYSAISHLNKPGVNIMTAEDPVEYNFHGINQVQIKEEIGLTFASALRSFLRQDPDIILVGEIRDYETVEIAVKAALTGHLVFSTLHTNDAPSTITRLLNMGVEPYLITSSVILVIAQRLARRICDNCRTEKAVTSLELLKIGFTEEEIKEMRVYTGKGCSVCNNSGYRGRVALFELMSITDELKELILKGAPVLEIKRLAISQGMQTLRRNGLNKIKEGLTTIDEVVRVTSED